MVGKWVPGGNFESSEREPRDCIGVSTLDEALCGDDICADHEQLRMDVSFSRSLGVLSSSAELDSILGSGLDGTMEKLPS